MKISESLERLVRERNHAKELAETLAKTHQNTEKKLLEFVKPKLANLHFSARRSLIKTLGSERFDTLTVDEIGSENAWLLLKSFQIMEVNETSIVIQESSRFSSKSESIALNNTILNMSNWDFASQTRKSVRQNIKECAENQTKVAHQKAKAAVDEARRALLEAEKNYAEVINA